MLEICKKIVYSINVFDSRFDKNYSIRYKQNNISKKRLTKYLCCIYEQWLLVLLKVSPCTKSAAYFIFCVTEKFRYPYSIHCNKKIFYSRPKEDYLTIVGHFLANCRIN